MHACSVTEPNVVGSSTVCMCKQIPLQVGRLSLPYVGMPPYIFLVTHEAFYGCMCMRSMETLVSG